jgi:hypothetical protein
LIRVISSTIRAVAIVGVMAVLLMAALAACSPAAPSGSTATPSSATSLAEVPTLIPTFTPTAAPTVAPTATNSPTPSDTATVTPESATATGTTIPATPTRVPPTATRRPLATFTPVPPTDTPKPTVDFKVIESRLWGAVENGGTSQDGSSMSCGMLHAFFIKTIDKNGAPLNGIIVKRVYVGKVDVPPTGSKGDGKTEDDPGTGNAYFVIGDVSGHMYTSETTRGMSVDNNIPNVDLIASGYCRDDAECNFRKANNELCYRHYSYSVTFQRQW